MDIRTFFSRWLIFAAGCVMLSAAPAMAGPAVIAQHWEGTYYYGNARQAVPFTLDFTKRSGKLRGRASEPATFGDGSSLMLHANVVGSFDGSTITFVKTYDGTGGQTHSVNYTGTVSANGRHMSGNWTLSGDTGAFTADVR